MSRVLIVIAASVLVLHGLIHLMGTTVYMKLGSIENLPYKTTVLGGRVDLGERGMKVFGALWAVAAAGFVVAGAALIVGWPWWRPLLVAVTIFSLALTATDWTVAYAGAIIDIVILLVLWLGPHVMTAFGS